VCRAGKVGPLSESAGDVSWRREVDVVRRRIVAVGCRWGEVSVRDGGERVLNRFCVRADGFFEDTAEAFIEGNVEKCEPPAVEPGGV
jgi:hypothetical protein